MWKNILKIMIKNESIYCTTKHVILGLSRSLHEELKIVMYVVIVFHLFLLKQQWIKFLQTIILKHFLIQLRLPE